MSGEICRGRKSNDAANQTIKHGLCGKIVEAFCISSVCPFVGIGNSSRKSDFVKHILNNIQADNTVVAGYEKIPTGAHIATA